MCQSPDYKHYVLAHMKDLKYLDYRLADQEQVKESRAKYLDELIALEEEEKIQMSKKQDTKVQDERNKLNEVIYMKCIYKV